MVSEEPRRAGVAEAHRRSNVTAAQSVFIRLHLGEAGRRRDEM